MAALSASSGICHVPASLYNNQLDCRNTANCSLKSSVSSLSFRSKLPSYASKASGLSSTFRASSRMQSAFSSSGSDFISAENFLPNDTANVHKRSPKLKIVASEQSKNTLKIVISGAPASGKGTQCEEIVKKYGLAHISAGDLLRYEVANNTEYGKRVKSFMDEGKLVPDEVVINIVKERLNKPDAVEKGWLLDGYPRSGSQAAALEQANIKPQLFIILDVPDSILIDRVVGRRLDPVTNKIYHLKFSPPENETINSRLIQRSDDTEEKVVVRLQTHKDNVDAVKSYYTEIIETVDGNRPKLEVFEEIDTILGNLLNSISDEENLDQKKNKPLKPSEYVWRGVPTRLNTTPHGREIRNYFYQDTCSSTINAINAGLNRLRIQVTFPELNPEMDVFRIGTLLELMRELAFTFAKQGRKVKVCVQGAMGKGIFTGMPLALSGTRRLLELMDWGDYRENALNPKLNLISIGTVGVNEVEKDDDIFLIMAPQNAIGNCIIDDLEAMTNACEDKTIIIINPRLKDIPGAGGVMQIQGRDKRLDFVSSFFTCYNFRLLYLSGTQYPILGALRMAYPSPYEVYKRVENVGVEKYQLMSTFDHEPNSSEIGDSFEGRKKSAEVTGFWKFMNQILG